MHYLLKSEPDHYSFDDLLRDKETVWDGIKNPQALATLRNMRKGERCVLYHSNTGKEAVGTATVLSVDPTDPKNPAIRLKAGKRLPHPVPLSAMRDHPLFADSPLFRQFRLSVVPLTDTQYDWLLHAEIPSPASKPAASTPKKTQNKTAPLSKPKPPSKGSK